MAKINAFIASYTDLLQKLDIPAEEWTALAQKVSPAKKRHSVP